MEECRKSLLPPVVWNFLKLHKHGQASQLQKSGSCHVLGALGPRRIWAWYGSKFSKRLASKHVNPRIMTTSFVGQLAPLLRPHPRASNFYRPTCQCQGANAFCSLYTLHLHCTGRTKGHHLHLPKGTPIFSQQLKFRASGFAISLLQ